jgi:hypothetical protein
MRIRTAVVVAAVALGGGGTAYADGAPSAGVSQGGAGVMWGSLRYVALPAPGGTSVAQIDASSGSVNGFVSLRGAWGIPIVAFDGTTAGVSAGGHTLVLAQSTHSLLPARSRFALVNPAKMRRRSIVSLRGAFFFDAISPDGATMYLIQHTSARNVLRYAVRAYDLRHGRLEPGAIVDTTEPDERMAGYPVSRAASPDGVRAYTLYQKPSGRMFVHVLDTSAGTARCVDLPPLIAQVSPGLSLESGRLDVVAAGQVLAAVNPATLAVTRSPAPAATSSPPPKRHPTAPRRADRVPLWAAIPVGLVLAGVALAVVRRRRPARGRSGGAAAGAPSGP